MSPMPEQSKLVEEAVSVARSVRQAKWNGEEHPPPTYRPSVGTFPLWVGYAKQLANAVLDSVELARRLEQAEQRDIASRNLLRKLWEEPDGPGVRTAVQIYLNVLEQPPNRNSGHSPEEVVDG